MSIHSVSYFKILTVILIYHLSAEKGEFDSLFSIHYKCFEIVEFILTLESKNCIALSFNTLGTGLLGGVALYGNMFAGDIKMDSFKCDAFRCVFKIIII